MPTFEVKFRLLLTSARRTKCNKMCALPWKVFVATQEVDQTSRTDVKTISNSDFSQQRCKY